MSVEQEIKDCVNDFLNEEFNCSDPSVGIYPIGEMDEDIVKVINEEVEGFIVNEWDKHSFTIKCEGYCVKVKNTENGWRIID